MVFRQAARRPLEVELDAAGELGAREDSGLSVEAIRQGLAQLAPNQRAALVMRELDDRSYAEIAEALGLTESAVETLLFRARRALREQLESVSSCNEARRLLAADELEDGARKRLRAHIRSCGECATLERRRRGKLAAAARKIAGFFPAPSWLTSLLGSGGAKIVVAVAAATVAATAAETAKPDSRAQQPKPGLALVARDAIDQGTVVAPAIASASPQPGAAQAARTPAPVARPSRAPVQGVTTGGAHGPAA